jgi:hypothetical protein
MNWYAFRSGHGLILTYYPSTCLDKLRKTTKNLSQDSQSLGPRFEPGTSQICIHCMILLYFYTCDSEVQCRVSMALLDSINKTGSNITE